MRELTGLLLLLVICCVLSTSAEAADCGCKTKCSSHRSGCACEQSKCQCGNKGCGCKQQCRSCACDGGYHRMTLEHKQDRERLARLKASERETERKASEARRGACGCGDCSGKCGGVTCKQVTKCSTDCRCSAARPCGCGKQSCSSCKSGCGCGKSRGGTSKCGCKTSCSTECKCKCQGNCQCSVGRCCDECAVRKGQRRNPAGTTFLRDSNW